MNRGDLRQAVLDHQFSPTRYTTFINDSLNEGQRRIARKANLRIFFDTETITTAAGDNEYPLPDDFARLHSLTTPSTNTPLTSITVDEFDTFPVTNSSGTPTAFTIDRPNVKFYPAPDGEHTFQMRYYRSPVAMTDDEDEPELPEDYHYLLVTYSLYRCFRRENDYEAAQFHQAEFERELAEMTGDLQDDAQDATQPQQVPGMWDNEGVGITAIRP